MEKKELVGVKIVSSEDSFMTKDVKVLVGDTKMEGITSISIDMKPEGFILATIEVLVNHLDVNSKASVGEVCAICNKTMDLDSQLRRNERVIRVLREEIEKLKDDKE